MNVIRKKKFSLHITLYKQPLKKKKELIILKLSEVGIYFFLNLISMRILYTILVRWLFKILNLYNSVSIWNLM